MRLLVMGLGMLMGRMGMRGRVWSGVRRIGGGMFGVIWGEAFCCFEIYMLVMDWMDVLRGILLNSQ